LLDKIIFQRDYHAYIDFQWYVIIGWERKSRSLTRLGKKTKEKRGRVMIIIIN